MRFGKVVHIIFYDMYRGIKHNKYRYMICVFLIFSLMATFYLDVSVLRRGTRGDLPIAGVFDYIFYLLEGITEVTEKAYKEGKFVFPYIWIAVQFMCAFLVMSYPKNDLEGVGLNVLILSKSKKIWWISKCLWIFVSVFSIYLLIGIIAMLFTLLSGGTLEAVIHYEIFESLFTDTANKWKSNAHYFICAYNAAAYINGDFHSSDGGICFFTANAWHGGCICNRNIVGI